MCTFRNSQIINVDFAECDLSESSFEGSTLTRTIFENTNLEKVDFRSAAYYSIDPLKNKIKKAKFSFFSGVAGLLEKFDIIVDNTI